MIYYLVLQHTYQGVELGLFKDQTTIQIARDDKKKASKNIVALVAELLQANDISFDDLAFIAANQGPGPFTTLRVVIASVNGLGFATKKPLVGIDGLNALLDEYASKNKDQADITVAMLNAFSGDVYFGINNNKNGNRNTGYQNAKSLFTYLKDHYPQQSIHFIGQAVAMHQELIQQTFGAQAVIPQNIPQNCSLTQVASMALQHWNKKEKVEQQLLPTYLKSMSAKIKRPSNF